MRQTWKQLVAGIMGLALVLPAAIVFAQDDRPGPTPARDAVRDEVDRNVDREVNRDADRNLDRRVESPTQASPSDMPAPIPMNEPTHHRNMQAMPRQSMGNACCCGGSVMYSRGYVSAPAMPRSGGYRSYSYQADDSAAYAAPMPMRSYDTYYDGGYWNGNAHYNGANWDRRHESDRTNFSGSYGSRASLYSGR
jgi:hypothetical protein